MVSGEKVCMRGFVATAWHTRPRLCQISAPPQFLIFPSRVHPAIPQASPLRPRARNSKMELCVSDCSLAQFTSAVSFVCACFWWLASRTVTYAGMRLLVRHGERFFFFLNNGQFYDEDLALAEVIQAHRAFSRLFAVLNDFTDTFLSSLSSLPLFLPLLSWPSWFPFPFPPLIPSVCLRVFSFPPGACSSLILSSARLALGGQR